MARLVYQMDSLSQEQIENHLLWFNEKWMPQDSFIASLTQSAYGNQALLHIFISYCEQLKGHVYSLSELKNLQSATPNIEHILAQTPNFSPTALGFNSAEDFVSWEDSLGNLMALERKFNSEIKNKVPVEKTVTYGKSIFPIAQKAGTQIATEMKFDKADLQKRAKELVKFCTERWWCKKPEYIIPDENQSSMEPIEPSSM